MIEELVELAALWFNVYDIEADKELYPLGNESESMIVEVLSYPSKGTLYTLDGALIPRPDPSMPWQGILVHGTVATGFGVRYRPLHNEYSVAGSVYTSFQYAVRESNGLSSLTRATVSITVKVTDSAIYAPDLYFFAPSMSINHRSRLLCLAHCKLVSGRVAAVSQLLNSQVVEGELLSIVLSSTGTGRSSALGEG